MAQQQAVQQAPALPPTEAISRNNVMNAYINGRSQQQSNNNNTRHAKSPIFLFSYNS